MTPSPAGSQRQQLDRLFAFDSMASVVFGVLALISPHHVVEQLGGGYNHAAHETLRCVSFIHVQL